MGNLSSRRFAVAGTDVGQINEVTLRRARLVLGWVTVSGSTPTQVNSAWPSLPGWAQ